VTCATSLKLKWLNWQRVQPRSACAPSKDVLNNDLVRRYFIRYKVRRVMTPNGVRTAGISLLVRMDDPLIPEDQEI
jgi:hypothetical protein